MINITDPGIEKYLMKLSFERDPAIVEMERIAKKKDFPIVDRLVGRFLYLITKIKRPRLVVELGSGFGYSAYWFARAMEKGKVVLTDYKQENIDYAMKLFSGAGMISRARFHTGDALESALRYKNIDILFMDIDKEQYPGALKAIKKNLSNDAIVITDNTLWYGRVIEGKKDRETKAIVEFNRMMYEDSDFFSTIVPLRDGLLVACKVN